MSDHHLRSPSSNDFGRRSIWDGNSGLTPDGGTSVLRPPECGDEAGRGWEAPTLRIALGCFPVAEGPRHVADVASTDLLSRDSRSRTDLPWCELSSTSSRDVIGQRRNYSRNADARYRTPIHSHVVGLGNAPVGVRNSVTGRERPAFLSFRRPNGRTPAGARGLEMEVRVLSDALARAGTKRPSQARLRSVEPDLVAARIGHQAAEDATAVGACGFGSNH